MLLPDDSYWGSLCSHRPMDIGTTSDLTWVFYIPWDNIIGTTGQLPLELAIHFGTIHSGLLPLPRQFTESFVSLDSLFPLVRVRLSPHQGLKFQQLQGDLFSLFDFSVMLIRFSCPQRHLFCLLLLTTKAAKERLIIKPKWPTKSYISSLAIVHNSVVCSSSITCLTPSPDGLFQIHFFLCKPPSLLSLPLKTMVEKY